MMLTKSFQALIKREFWEYRNSFIIAPIVVGSICTVLLLLSMLIAGRLSIMSDDDIQIIIGDGELLLRDLSENEKYDPDAHEMVTIRSNIEQRVIQLKHDIFEGDESFEHDLKSFETDVRKFEADIKKFEHTVEKVTEKIEGADSKPNKIVINIDLDLDDLGLDNITVPEPPAAMKAPSMSGSHHMDKGWDFKEDWILDGGDVFNEKLYRVESGSNLGSVLQVINLIFVFVLFLVSFSYVLYTLFQDRKDRSILFWRSMPVSELETVLAKFSIVTVAAPLITFVISILTQVVCIALAMSLYWFIGKSPIDAWSNLELFTLWFNQFAMLVTSSLWVAPFYAWILCSSAFAQRSPIQVLLVPLVVISLAELWIMGSNHIFEGIWERVPPLFSGYFYWRNISCNESLLDLHGMFFSIKMWLGLAATVGMICFAAKLRKKRSEI